MTDYVPVHKRQDNKCKQFPRQWWFNNSNRKFNTRGTGEKNSTLTKDNESAINLCNLCPNKFDCLAENVLVKFHIVGGLTADQRAVLRSRLEQDQIIAKVGPKHTHTLELPTADGGWKLVVSEQVLRQWLHLNWATESKSKTITQSLTILAS